MTGPACGRARDPRRPVADLKAAVAGVGFIGVVHVEALRRLGVEVVGVCAQTPDLAREVGLRYPLPHIYDGFDELLDDPTVDVVHVATPNHLHASQVRQAIAAGKHVVCEKPLALTSTESGELAELARESGRVCAVNFMARFYPQVREMRERCRRGDLGDLFAVHGSYLQDWLLWQTDWNWRLDPALGGSLRAVADIGSHWLDLVEFVTNRRIEAVLGDLATFVSVRLRPSAEVETFSASKPDAGVAEVPMQTEDAASVLLHLEGGARGSLTVSQVAAGRKNALAFEVDGSRASAAWCSERPEELWIGHRDRANELLLRDPTLLTPEARGSTSMPGGHSEGFQETFRELYRIVYAAVAAGAPPAVPDYPTFEDGHRAVLVGEAIARSARRARWTEVYEGV